MSDIKNVRPGESILSNFTADAFNAFAAAARSEGGSHSGISGEPDSNGCRVWIQNNTGRRLDRFAVVGLGAPVFSPSGAGLSNFLNQPLIAGALPVVATHAYRFGILQQLVPSGDNGQALVIGVTPVLVNVTDITHTYADVAAGVTDYLTSKAAGGAKLLTTPTQTGQQWMLARVGLPPPAAQNYLEYDLITSLNGFDTATYGNPALDSTHLTGWTGSINRAGSESDVGIEYQTSETAPQTNGLYKVTKDGLFRITIDGQIKYQSVGTRTPQNMTNVTSGPASAPEAAGEAAHTHSVTPVGHEAALGDGTGRQIFIELFNKKASGGANAIHANALTYFYRWTTMLPALISGGRLVHVHCQWNVCLSQNDKLSLKWRYVTPDGNTAILIRDGDPLLMRFEYIGPKADWAAM